jgi:hypothetical protein
MPLKACLGCTVLIRSGSRCRRCKLRPSGWAQSRFRQRVLRQHGPTCVICGESPVQAHHIVPLHDGGDFEGEGVPLCDRHHEAAHSSK